MTPRLLRGAHERTQKQKNKPGKEARRQGSKPLWCKFGKRVGPYAVCLPSLYPGFLELRRGPPITENHPPTTSPRLRVECEMLE